MFTDTRGSGRTTRQMQEAPQRAVFVWVNSNTSYPRHLAQHLGRGNLEIISPENLPRLRGRVLTAVVYDHAIESIEHWSREAQDARYRLQERLQVS